MIGSAFLIDRANHETEMSSSFISSGSITAMPARVNSLLP